MKINIDLKSKEFLNYWANQGATYKGELSCATVKYVGSISEDECQLFCFYSDKEDASKLRDFTPQIILVDQQLPISEIENKFLIRVEEPRIRYAKFLIDFLGDQFEMRYDPGILRKPQIGNATRAFSGSWLGNCLIGENCVIMSNCFISDDVSIGNDVIVMPNAVIGTDGFGFTDINMPSMKRFPHFGRVIIADGVEIGSNSTIDRGALEDTIVGSNTKINSNVHIGHNVKIGKNVVIGGNVHVSGSVIIGDGTYIAPGVVIRDRIMIGDNCFIGMGAVVIEDVEDNDIVYGVPARSKGKREI